MRVALAQLNTTAGDIGGNVRLIRRAWERAAADGAELLVVPELAVVGYPPRDLLLRAGVQRAAQAATADLARAFAGGPAAVVGTIAPNPEPVGPGIVNAAVLLAGGRIETVYAKRLLPTYDVFDERRYFGPGHAPAVVTIAGRRIGLLVCEDMWVRDLVRGRHLYDADPPADLRAAGIDLAVGISASPYHAGKDATRSGLFAGEARRMGVPLVSVHQVGGNDEVLFDGRSRVYDADGEVCLTLAAFEPDYRVVDVGLRGCAREPPAPVPTAAAETWSALVMGLRDYCRKTRMRDALVGLSGGVDSAVVACLAAEALGPEHVLAIGMPGPYTADMSREDAHALAQALGIEFREIPIRAPYEGFVEALRASFQGLPFDVTEENLQARVRGSILMALSNKFGHIVLATGNKSEIAVGYCTLYGDMNGGLAVISDVWKTGVYALARPFVERGVIPRRIVERPPSAELAPGQEDADSLPPYPTLDRILHARIEVGASYADIVASGEDPALVEGVLRMVERNEYKRRQLAPGLKVSPTAFGVGWRMPIARPYDLSGEV